MKAYGSHRLIDLNDYGPPTRTGKLTSSNRRKGRRLLKKKARLAAKVMIRLD